MATATNNHFMLSQWTLQKGFRTQWQQKGSTYSTKNSYNQKQATLVAEYITKYLPAVCTIYPVVDRKGTFQARVEKNKIEVKVNADLPVTHGELARAQVLLNDFSEERTFCIRDGRTLLQISWHEEREEVANKLASRIRMSLRDCKLVQETKESGAIQILMKIEPPDMPSLSQNLSIDDVRFIIEILNDYFSYVRELKETKPLNILPLVTIEEVGHAEQLLNQFCQINKEGREEIKRKLDKIIYSQSPCPLFPVTSYLIENHQNGVYQLHACVQHPTHTEQASVWISSDSVRRIIECLEPK